MSMRWLDFFCTSSDCRRFAPQSEQFSSYVSNLLLHSMHLNFLGSSFILLTSNFRAEIMCFAICQSYFKKIIGKQDPLRGAADRFRISVAVHFTPLQWSKPLLSGIDQFQIFVGVSLVIGWVHLIFSNFISQEHYPCQLTLQNKKLHKVLVILSATRIGNYLLNIQ